MKRKEEIEKKENYQRVEEFINSTQNDRQFKPQFFRKAKLQTQSLGINLNIWRFITNLFQKSGIYSQKLNFLQETDLKLVNDLASHHEPLSENDTLTLASRKINLLFAGLIKFIEQRYLVLHPETKQLKVWDFLHSLAILFSVFYIPLEWVYDTRFTQKYSWRFEGLVLAAVITFLTNIIFNLNQGFYNKGSLVMDRKAILIRFIKQYLASDVIALLPILNSYFLIFDIPTIFNLVIFFKLQTLQEIISGYQEMFLMRQDPMIPSIIRLIKLILFIILVAHLFAILFLGVTRIDTGSHLNWIMKYGDGNITKNLDIKNLRCFFLLLFPFLILGLDEQQWYVQYLYAFYWSVTTMTTVGYGDITPANVYEVGLNIITLFVSCGVFSYSFGLIGMIVQDMNAKRTQYTNLMRLLGRYIKENHISSELEKTVRKDLEFRFSSDSELSPDEIKVIFQLVDPNLQKKLNQESHLRFLNFCPPLKDNFSPKVLERLTSEMVLQNLVENQVIFEQNSLPDEENSYIYFIKSGEIELYVQNFKNQDTNLIPIKTLGKMEYFGELNFFLMTPRLCSARSQGISQIFYLSRQQFLDIIRDQSDDLERYLMIRDRAFFMDYYMLQFKCFSCERAGHNIKNCPKIHYIPNKEKIYLSHLCDQYNKRRSCRRRKVRSKHTFHFLKENEQIISRHTRNLATKIYLNPIEQNQIQEVKLELQQESQQKINTENIPQIAEFQEKELLVLFDTDQEVKIDEFDQKYEKFDKQIESSGVVTFYGDLDYQAGKLSQKQIGDLHSPPVSPNNNLNQKSLENSEIDLIQFDDYSFEVESEDEKKQVKKKKDVQDQPQIEIKQIEQEIQMKDLTQKKRLKRHEGTVISKISNREIPQLRLVDFGRRNSEELKQNQDTFNDLVSPQIGVTPKFNENGNLDIPENQIQSDRIQIVPKSQDPNQIIFEESYQKNEKPQIIAPVEQINQKEPAGLDTISIFRNQHKERTSYLSYLNTQNIDIMTKQDLMDYFDLRQDFKVYMPNHNFKEVALILNKEKKLKIPRDKKYHLLFRQQYESDAQKQSVLNQTSKK